MKSILLFSFLLLTATITFGQATANQPADMLICDEPPFDGLAIFDLTQNDAEILGSQNPASYDVGYFESQVDADANVNPFVNPTSYINISNPQQVYVRVTNQGNGDFDTTSFALIVEPGPSAVIPSPIEICDIDNDGFALFDLTIRNAEIVGGDPDLSVTYHETLLDAENGINALLSPYQNISASFQTVYARVESNTTGCFVTVPLDLVVFNSPTANQPNNLFINEGDGDGVANFDLTVNDAVVSIGITNPLVFYYETLSDAQSLVNNIDPATMYTNTSNPQEIFVAVINDDTQCYDVVSFIIATDQSAQPDTDSDGVPDAIEDTNANGDLTDDDADNDTIPNYEDNDDDGDGTLTIQEDYNNNGSPTDDDTNNNRIPDYLDSGVTLSVSETAIELLRIYPNPVTSELSINLGSSYDTIAIAVYTLQGMVVFKSNKYNANTVLLDVSSYATGIYFLKVDTKDETATIKFIKK